MALEMAERDIWSVVSIAVGLGVSATETSTRMTVGEGASCMLSPAHAGQDSS